MRSGVGKRIVNKVTAITFILILLMQMVMPLFVNAEISSKEPVVKTKIGYDLSDLNVNFKITQIEKHNDIIDESYKWEKSKDGINWQIILTSSQKNIQQTRSETRGYQYRCTSEIQILNYKKLVYDAYTMMLRYGTDVGPDSIGYNDWQTKLRNHTNVDHMINTVVKDTGENEDDYRHETTSIALSMLISIEYLGNYWNASGGDANSNNVRELIKRLTIFFKGRDPTDYEYEFWTNEYYTYKQNVNNWEKNLTVGGETQQYTRGMLHIIQCISTEGISLDYMYRTYNYINYGYINNGLKGKFPDTITTDIIKYTSTSNIITIPEYQVTLKVEGESGIQNVTGEGTYHAGDTVSISATLKTGYNWVNWMKKGTLIEVSRDQTFNYTIPYEENITLLACATPISYTVVYDGNGNTGGSTPSTTHIYNRTKNIASNGYTRSYTITYNGNGGTTPSEQISNYTFYRWAQYANGTGNTYTSGQTNVGNLSSTDGATVTLYAQWEPVAVNLPSTSRNAYTFGGWYNGTSRIGGIGDSYIPTTNTTLNAHWDLIKTNVAGNIEWNDRK